MQGFDSLTLALYGFIGPQAVEGRGGNPSHDLYRRGGIDCRVGRLSIIFTGEAPNLWHIYDRKHGAAILAHLERITKV